MYSWLQFWQLMTRTRVKSLSIINIYPNILICDPCSNLIIISKHFELYNARKQHQMRQFSPRSVLTSNYINSQNSHITNMWPQYISILCIFIRWTDRSFKSTYFTNSVRIFAFDNIAYLKIRTFILRRQYFFITSTFFNVLLHQSLHYPLNIQFILGLCVRWSQALFILILK